MSSPNMLLPIPVPSQTGGPQYALDEQSCFNQIDSHNHTTGQGVQIPTAGININADLSMNSLSVTNLKSVKFLNNIVVPGTASLYMDNDDLYWAPGSGGASVQLTIGSTIAGAPGNITNLVPPASAVFDNPSSSFIFSSNTNIAAGMDIGPLTVRNTTVSSNGITINAPNPLAANYSLTLPPAQASTTSVIVVDNAGVMSFLSTSFLLPAGSVIPFAGTVAPSGWLFCNGQVLDSIANPQYAALFAAIGTAFGGTGANSFNVPDTRGVFVRGAGSQTISGETYTATLGASQNDATAVNGLTVTAVGDHAHTTTNSGTAGGAYTNPAQRLTWTSDATFQNTYTTSSAGAHTHALTGDTETRPANVAMNYIIRY